MNLTLHDIVGATGAQLVSGFPTTACSGVSIDTRTLKKGDLFFALRGPRFDGHQFLATAFRKKAAAVVLEKMPSQLQIEPGLLGDIVEVKDSLTALQETARYIRSSLDNTTVIGLTGSNGKTTTKEMLACILRRVGKTLATRGNLNNQIGLPLMLCELDRADRFAVLELGTSKKGDMDLLVALARPDVALITNVGKDHLEFLETPEGVLQENRKLFDGLPKTGIAIINMDDPLLKPLAGMLPWRTVTYGLSQEAEIRATDIRPFPSPLRFNLNFGKEKLAVSLQGMGEIQVLNALAAAAVAFALGVESKEVVDGLLAFKPAPMRMQEIRLSDSAGMVNDAYNANPSSMRASISSFCQSYPNSPRWLVLGDMRELGSIAREEHRALGVWISEQPIDKVYLYGRDTRFVRDGLTENKFKGIVERHRKKRYLIESLKKSLSGSTKPAILFKASRRMELEKVCNALLSTPS